ncbi:MAG: MFS transporter [Candidatus Methanomethylicia archaeon]
MGDFKFKLVFLCFSHTLLHVYTELPLALIPIIKSEYELPFLIVSLIVAIPRLSSLLLSIPSGLIADRFGATKVISISLFLEFLAGVIILSTNSIEFIVLGFSLTSIASTLYHPPALSAAANILPSNFRSRGMGFHGASGTLGVAIGPLTLGLVLNRFGWKYAYLVWIIPILISIIVSIIVKIDFGISEGIKSKSDNSKVSVKSSFKEVLNSVFIFFLIIMLFRDAAGTSISTYITSYFTYERGLDPAISSIIFGLSPLLGLISNLVGGFIGDKFGLRNSFTFIISMLILSIFGIIFSPSIYIIVLMYLTYGFFSSMTMPITSSIVACIVKPEYRGTAYSLEFVPMSLIGIIMPVILSILITSLGLSIIFIVAIVLYFIALVLFINFGKYLQKGK